MEPAPGKASKKFTILAVLVIVLCGAAVFLISRDPAKKADTNAIIEGVANYKDPVYGVEFSYPGSWGDVEKGEGNPVCPEEDTYRTPETLSVFDRELKFADRDLENTESMIRSGIRFYRIDPKVSNNCNDEVLRKLAAQEITGEEFSSFRLTKTDVPGFYGIHNEQASRLDTEFREQYTFFKEEPDGKVLVIQPYVSFIPYFDSPEWAEIEQSYKGDILSFIKKGVSSSQTRKYLAEFRRMAESFKLSEQVLQ